MESATGTVERMRARPTEAAVNERVAPAPRGNWLSRLAKSIADLLRRRRYSRNRAKLRPPKESGRLGAS